MIGWSKMVNEKHKRTDNAYQVAQRRDEALRRALQTPPKHHEDMKLGKKKKQKLIASASKKT